MIYLESINLVQFFLFERTQVRVSEITGIFGPNASGKSSFLDAVQIAMFGANGRLMVLNAQADENKTTRSIRSYCLGQHGENPDDRARQHANTYITLIWRNSETNKPISMGVCIYASKDREQHDVLGRYLLPGVELTLGNHLETVDGKEKPREWGTFKQQLIQRAKVMNPEAEPIYPEAERYIRACLLELRGSSGIPSYEQFIRAFRFGLRMRFDKTVDEIVRNDVLEAKSTNIKKFKEVTESFRQLTEMVAHIDQKIKDGTAVETAFANATKASRKVATWKALGLDVALEQANQVRDSAEQAMEEAREAFGGADKELNDLTSQRDDADSKTNHYRSLRDQHSSHADYAGLGHQISEQESKAQRKTNEIVQNLHALRDGLKKAADAKLLDQLVTDSLVSESARLTELLEQFSDSDWPLIERCLHTAVSASNDALLAVNKANGKLDEDLGEANKTLENAKVSLLRVKEGKIPLSPNVENLMRELRDHGLNPVVVCDQVKVAKKEWQPVIEAYLGPNLQAILVAEHEERKAFEIYRGMTGRRAVYGAKIVMESRQQVGRHPEDDSVAELIEGSHPAAVAFLRSLFGDMAQATTDAQAMGGKRTLTVDGMIVGKGIIDRLKPVPDGDLRIGRDGGEQHRDAAIKRVAECEKTVLGLVATKGKVNELFKLLRAMPAPGQAETFTKKVWGEALSALETAASLRKGLEGAADEEYVKLGQQVGQWTNTVKDLNAKMTAAAGRRGVAENALSERENDVRIASVKSESAGKTSKEACNNSEYDPDYAASQWDMVLEKFDGNIFDMADYCKSKMSEATAQVARDTNTGSRLLGEFLEKYREQASQAVLDDWRKGQAWVNDILKRLRDTELLEYKTQLDHAYKVSQQTFRNDVALVLNQHIEALDLTMERLNKVLKECPAFSNGEHYQFKRTVRPSYEKLLDFIKDIGKFGAQEDLLGGVGDIPKQFEDLLKEKTATGAGSVVSPLDDYREFYEFNIEIMRKDPLTSKDRVAGHLSKRIGPGSGGEHRAPLYVIAGAAMASAYKLDRNNRDGIRLILLDEAFNKMDPTNITATMRYLEDLGLQVFMASPGENQGVLNAFMHRYYDIIRDTDRNVVFVEGHDITQDMRDMFMSDDPDVHPELVEREVNRMRAEGMAGAQIS